MNYPTMPVQQQQRPIATQQNQRPRCRGFGCCGAKKPYNQMTLDEKTKLATFRVEKLNKKLRCCSCLFTTYGIGFFLSAVMTFAGARYNSSFMAQTGYMPWTHPIKDFVPSEEPAKYEFTLYDSFLKMGFLSMLLSFVMFMFVMRTVIAKWLQKPKNTRIAFHRTLGCMIAFFFVYYFTHENGQQFMQLYKQIAEEKGITMEDNFSDYRNLGSKLGLDDALQHFTGNQTVFQQPKSIEQPKQHFHKKHHWQQRTEAAPAPQMPQQESPEQMQERDQFIQQWAPKLAPYVKEYEIANGMRQPTPEDMEEMEMPEEKKKCHGMCPVFILVIISMIGQAVILKMHERALLRLKTLKRAKEIATENAQRQQVVDVEAQPQTYQPVAIVTEEAATTDQINYSFEEPASPEDKSDSGMVFSFSDRDIKINTSSSSITVSNNMI